ncbi:MAG: YraN family protein [Phycisphaerales bacterium]|nr:YraN family protein [Phycisphaerales bacterium]
MSDPRHALGLAGEKLAESHLAQLGMKCLARRFATPAGELDLVMVDGDTVVFVEVKTRADRALADPQDAVTPAKQRRLGRAARWFLSQKRLERHPCRFDVVGVILAPPAPPRIEHIRDFAALDE